MITIPNLEKGGMQPNFQVICKGHVFYDWRKQEKMGVQHIRNASYFDFNIRSKDLLVYDDVRIQFYSGKKTAFHFWFNTFFIDRSGMFYINKAMIDDAHKDMKKNLIYDKNFSIKVYMTQVEE